MPEAVRIIGHNDNVNDNEQLQLQVFKDGSIPTRSGGYQGSDIDETGETRYYGLVDSEGNWKIVSTSVSGAIRYCKGESGYALAWSNRASQTYDYYFNTF